MTWNDGNNIYEDLRWPKSDRKWQEILILKCILQKIFGFHVVDRKSDHTYCKQIYNRSERKINDKQKSQPIQLGKLKYQTSCLSIVRLTSSQITRPRYDLSQTACFTNAGSRTSCLTNVRHQVSCIRNHHVRPLFYICATLELLLRKCTYMWSDWRFPMRDYKTHI